MTASANASSEHVTGGFQIGTALSQVSYTTAPTVAYSLVLQIANGDTLTLNPATGAVTGTVAGVYQVETATVTAAGGCTSNGTCNVVVTGAHITGSPLTVPVALTTATHTSASLIAAAIRAELQQCTIGNPDGYTTSGTGANIVVTDTSYRANDTTLNIAIPAGLGITAAATSANTTAGVAESKAYRINGQAWDQTDFEGVALPTMTKIYSTLVKSDTVDGSVNITGILTMDVYGSAFIDLKSCPDGDHPWATGTIEFSADDAIIYIDIHAGE